MDIETQIKVKVDMAKREFYAKLLEMKRNLRNHQREAREIGAYTSVAIYMAQEDILEEAVKELGLK